MRPIWIILAAVMLITTIQIFESESGPLDTGACWKSLRGFLVAIADYYRTPQSEAIIITERGIPSHEVAVVLFLAKKAHVPPEMITNLRLSGQTWLDITLRFGLNPEIFYVPVKIIVTGPPYQKVYKNYNGIPKNNWRAIRVSDDDIVNLVNLKFMSEHYNYPPEEIIKMRSDGKEFILINDEIKKGKMKN